MNNMKYAIQQLMTFVTLIVLSVSCISEDVPYNTTGDNQESDVVGYLEFSNLNVTVSYESEEISTKATSRASEEAPDDFIVSIYSEKEESVVYSATYAEAKSSDEPIALQPGVYTVSINSSEDEPLSAWESPYYSYTKSITIIKNITTELSDIVCTLSNIKTSITLSADLKDLFQADNGSDEDLNVNVAIGDASLDFDRNEDRNGYFKAVDESNTLKITLSGMYNTAAADEDPKYSPVSWPQEITGVAAGQWRKITIRIDNASDGTITFIVDVETWVYDENIDVDIMSQSFTLNVDEDVISDPDSEISDTDSAVVTLSGDHDIAEPFVITSESFDFDAESCLDILKANVTPASGATVASIEVTFTSDNDDFMEAVQSQFTDGSISLWSTNSAEEYLTIREADDVVTITAKYSAMIALYQFYGHHTAKIAVIDSLGRRSYTSLTIAVYNEGPAIVWRDGYDFDTRYNISLSSSLPVILDITSNSGISAFMIAIDSKVLNEATLTGLNLESEMDLINPATDEMAATLLDLGFPVGDQIKGATELVFDITEFMTPLAALGTGTSDFKLSVTDNAGTTIRTIMLNTVSE